MTDTPGRGWTRCRGCKRLRSTTDEDGICAGCQPLVAKGMIRPTDAEPAAPPVEQDAGTITVTVKPVLDEDATAALVADLAAATEPKQKPVKRRWWKRTR